MVFQIRPSRFYMVDDQAWPTSPTEATRIASLDSYGHWIYDGGGRVIRSQSKSGFGFLHRYAFANLIDKLQQYELIFDLSDDTSQ